MSAFVEPKLFTPVEGQRFRLWQAPLVPVAIAITLGILLDHFFDLPLTGSLFAASIFLVGWVAATRGPSGGLPLMYLLLSLTALGACYYHVRLKVWPRDDIGFHATSKPAPMQARGLLLETPRGSRAPGSQFYEVYSREELMPSSTLAVIQLTAILADQHWRKISGKALLVIRGKQAPAVRAGDEVEIIGNLLTPASPGNPGERDNRDALLRRGIRAVIYVKDPGGGVTRLRTSSRWSPSSVLAWLRGYGHTILNKALPEAEAQIASAILLGDRTGLPEEVRDRYRKAGVIYVLVISGQHFMVVALFLLWMLRVFQIRQRSIVLIVSGILILYAFLVGLHPPVVRACVTFCTMGWAILFRRKSTIGNALALAWIIVTLINPSEVFNPGCQLSFLAVATLHWVAAPVFFSNKEVDPLDQLIEETKPFFWRLTKRLLGAILRLYGVCAVLWVAMFPLIVTYTNLVPIAGLLLGPPIMALVSWALICGLALLVTAPLYWPLAMVFAKLTWLFLAVSDALIKKTLTLPYSYQWVGNIPIWWNIGFYALILTLSLLRLWGTKRILCCTTVLAWYCVLLLISLPDRSCDEMRVTFLSVGHGGCTVIEMPDGRTAMFDAGSLRNPHVTRRKIAPFLWQRGITRIDALYLSHADLDHYSGVPELVERFTIGQVITNPTFGEKQTEEVQQTLMLFAEHGIPVDTSHAGQRFAYGNVQIDVLHPPLERLPGSENGRSLVLLVEHEAHRLLLTGDLADEGLSRFLRQPPIPVEILMAPHHGSRASNTPALAQWTRPQVVVSSEGMVRGLKRTEPYVKRGATYLSTWQQGAITIRSHATGIILETFRAGLPEVIRSSRR